MCIQDPDGYSERATRFYNIPPTRRHAKTCQEVVGEEETLRNRVSKILGSLRRRGMRRGASGRNRIVATRLVLIIFERRTRLSLNSLDREE